MKINKKIKNNLIKFESVMIEHLLSTLPINSKMFLAEAIHKKKIIKHLTKKHAVAIVHDLIIAVDDNLDTTFVLFSVRALKDMLEYIEKAYRPDPIYFRIAKYEIDRYINKSLDGLKEIKIKYPESEINSHGITLHKYIRPNKCVLDGRIHMLPSHLVYPIGKISFITNPNGELTSVDIDGKHPNAENHSFCLGELRFRELNVDLVESIIELLHIYNLSSCYFAPEKIMNYIKRINNEVKST